MANKEKTNFLIDDQKGKNIINNNQGLRGNFQDEIKIPKFLLDEERTEKRTANKKQCKYYGHGYECLW